MTKRRLRYLFLPLFLSLASPMTLAQEPFSSREEPGRPRLPTADEMVKAQSRARDAMARMPDAGAQ